MGSRTYYEDLERNLQELLQNGKIGLSYLTSKDAESLPNNFIELTTGFKNFHFIVKIPYAGKKLTWEIIFDPEDYSSLPDFDFNDDTFLANPDIDIIFDNVPNWGSWNIKKSTALLEILNEFLVLFKKAQVDKLGKENIYCRFKNEYDDLLRIKDLGEENVEVYIENHLNFLISLPVDCFLIPEFLQPDNEEQKFQNPGEDFAHLSVTFLKLDNSHNKVTLQFSSRLDQVLGKLKLPKYKTETTLSEYVCSVQKMIQERIQLVVEQYHKKNKFISCLASIYSSSMVEYDVESLNKIVFMYDVEDYDCLIIITVGSKFPLERPKIQFLSLYCQEGRQCNPNFDNFPFDPSDSVEEMVHKIANSFKDAISIFKNHKH